MISIMFFASMIPQAQATVPQLITYNGILKNSAGSFLTGTYSMIFRLYTASTGGTASWTETQSTVSVSSGKFSVQLGSVSTLALAFSQDYWLSVQVGTDSEMSPRLRLTSAGYAYLAEDVTGGKLTGSTHAADSHMSIEGVRNAHTNIAKTNFKLDAYTLASANSMGDLIMDNFNDAAGIDASSSSNYTWRGSPNYDVIAGVQGGIDSNAVFMAHANGTDGSSTFTDSSSSAKSITAVGNAQVDTAQSKFSGASALFDGTGDYLSVANNADFDFGSGDFTIDAWVRFNNSNFFYGVAGKYSGSTGWIFTCNTGSGDMVLYDSGSSNVYVTSSFSAGVWYHIAVVRTGSVIKFFKDGIQVGTDKTAASTYNGAAAALTVGAYGSGSGAFDGWIDEIRVSKGVARWTSNFTPSTSEYTVPGSGSAAVISTAFTEPTAPTEAILTASQALGTGSITYYVSRNNGTNWTQCTNEQVCSLTGQPTGTQLRWKASISGNAELDAIAVAV